MDMGAYECPGGNTLFFHDTFMTDAPVTDTDLRGYDINFEYTKRQTGQFASTLLLENAGTANGNPGDFMTQVNNGGSQSLLIACWPFQPAGAQCNTPVAVGRSFTGSSDFERLAAADRITMRP